MTRWLSLAAVIAVHALVLGGVALGGMKAPEPITRPVVKVVLLAPPTPVAVSRPSPTVAPRSKPKTQPKAPAPVVTTSERAVTLPKPPQAPSLATDEHSGELAEDAASIPAGAAAETSVGVSGMDGPIGDPILPPHTDAAHLDNPVPEYPRLSRRFGEEGRVQLDVHILPDGSVGEIAIRTSSGFPRLDAAALETVRRWRYVPARRGSEPISYWYVQPITFSLER